jgi:hypothetical protein
MYMNNMFLITRHPARNKQGGRGTRPTCLV